MRPLSRSWLWRQSTSLKWVLPCNLFKQIHLIFNLEFLLKPGDRCWRCCSFIFASCHKISAESEKQRACRRIPGPVQPGMKHDVDIKQKRRSSQIIGRSVLFLRGTASLAWTDLRIGSMALFWDIQAEKVPPFSLPCADMKGLKSGLAASSSSNMSHMQTGTGSSDVICARLRGQLKHFLQTLGCQTTEKSIWGAASVAVTRKVTLIFNQTLQPFSSVLQAPNLSVVLRSFSCSRSPSAA